MLLQSISIYILNAIMGIMYVIFNLVELIQKIRFFKRTSW